MSIYNKDAALRPLLTVQSMPTNPNDWTEFTSPSVPAGFTLNLYVINTPNSTRLGLWDHLHSIRVDTNDDDHLYPGGASLTSAQRSLSLETWVDYAFSVDSINRRTYLIRIKNTDSSAHVYHVLYKAYTFVSSGSGATSI